MSDDDPLRGLLRGLNPDELMARALEGGADTVSASKDWEPLTYSELDSMIEGYSVEACLGRGGMAAVYLARQLGLDRMVAIKLLPLELTLDPSFVERFKREAKLTARLEHPGIVRIYESGETTEGHLYIVLEYINGVSLEEYLSKKPDVEQVLRFIPQLCRALEYAHDRGVVHRDLKPENVLITKDGVLKITDFGLAKLVHTDPSEYEQTLTRSNVGMGTPYYVSPEQSAGDKDIDHRTDIFSLGVMIYKMVTGRMPHGTWEPPSKEDGVDVRLDELVIRAMQRERSDRYQNVSAIREEVQAIISSPYRRLVMRTLRPGLRMMDVAWSIVGTMMFFLMTSALLRAQSPSMGTFFHIFEQRNGPLDGMYLMLHFFSPLFYGLMGFWVIKRWKICQDYEVADRIPTPFGFLAEVGSKEYKWLASFWFLLVFLAPAAFLVHFMRKVMKYSMGERWEQATVINRYTGETHGWWSWDSAILTEEPNLYAFGMHASPLSNGPSFWPVISPVMMLGGVALVMTFALWFLVLLGKSLRDSRSESSNK